MDRCAPRAHRRTRVVAVQREERGDVVFVVHQPPEALRAQAGECVLLLEAAAQPDSVLRGEGPFRVAPAGIGAPLLPELFGLISDPAWSGVCALEATVA